MLLFFAFSPLFDFNWASFIAAAAAASRSRSRSRFLALQDSSVSVSSPPCPSRLRLADRHSAHSYCPPSHCHCREGNDARRARRP